MLSFTVSASMNVGEYDYLMCFASFALCRSGSGVAAEETAKELLRFVLVESEIRVSVILLPEAAAERSEKPAPII